MHEPSTYEVEFLRKASQIPNELWDACFHCPGEGRWWYEALDQSGIEDQFTFFYGLIRRLGSPVGIAPVFTMDMPVEQVAPEVFLRLFRLVGKIVPSILCQRTLFVGSPVLDESRVGHLPYGRAEDRLGLTGRGPGPVPESPSGMRKLTARCLFISPCALSKRCSRHAPQIAGKHRT